MFKTRGLLLTSAVALSLTALAQNETGAPVGIKLAPGVRGIAQLDSEIVYTSNFFYRADNEVSSTGVLFRPSLGIEGDKGAFTYNLGLQGELSKWDVPGDIDDYEDSRISGAFKWDIATRHRLGGNISRHDSHDPFGTVRTEAGAALADRDLDQWHFTTMGLDYRFGAQGAKINLEAGVVTRDREYETNREFTRFIDYTTDQVRAAVIYNVSSKTGLLAEVIDSKREYDVNLAGFPRDGDERAYRVGARWKATGKTVGDVRVGRVEHDFEDPSGNDFEETDWSAGITWSPLLQARLILQTGRESQESYRTDTRLIDNEFVSLAWAHDWSSLFRTTLTFRRLDQRFVDSDITPATPPRDEREDEVDALSLLAEYRLSPTVQARGGLSRSSRDTNVANISEFDVDVAFVGLRVLF